MTFPEVPPLGPPTTPNATTDATTDATAATAAREQVLKSLRMVVGGFAVAVVVITALMAVTVAHGFDTVVWWTVLGPVLVAGLCTALASVATRVQPLSSYLTPSQARAQAIVRLTSHVLVRAALAEPPLFAGVVLAVLVPYSRVWALLAGAVLAVLLLRLTAWPSAHRVAAVRTALEREGVDSGLGDVGGLPSAVQRL